MDPTTAALEKEHEAVRGGNICITHTEKKNMLCSITMLMAWVSRLGPGGPVPCRVYLQHASAHLLEVSSMPGKTLISWFRCD